MTTDRRALRAEYVSAFGSYVNQGGEAGLSRAYELGRRAMMQGFGLLDMALLHQSALENHVLDAPPNDRGRRADAAATFLYEVLAPYELTLRGYRDANRELQALNATLQQQKAAAEAANRELEAFSYSVSHDLRAPLRSIDGFSQILVDELSDVLPDQGKRYLRRVRQATGQMGQLIDDLLALARVARTEIRQTDVDLSALVRSLSERIRAAAPERSATFTIVEGIHANGDPNLLSVVFENLLGNAWKFSSKREHTDIRFECELRDNTPRYVIRDNGAGFDMTYVGKLFGAFQRLHSSSEYEGTGIGLATVQRIVQRHGGRVWAEGNIDDGAAFYFTLGAQP
jgi:light-regulated signal transduction histidine kinase (bacteriophytochrome)